MFSGYSWKAHSFLRGKRGEVGLEERGKVGGGNEGDVGRKNVVGMY